MSSRYRKEKNCLNCGHQVEEHFCSRCGQENIIVQENALHMITHAVADYFHFESKFFGTIKPLLFKPGQLTQKYVAGKRVSFIHPIRLYIFISIVFFIVILSGNHEESEEKEKVNSKPNTEIDSAGRDSLKTIEAQQLRNTLQGMPMPGVKKDSLISDVVKDAAQPKKNKNYNSLNPYLHEDFWIEKTDTTIAAYEKRQLSLPKAKRDNLFENYIAKKSIRLQKYPDVWDKIKTEFLHNVPKLMFILLPLFAMILKLVYIRKKKYYYEHLIYSFHVHSALFLAIILTIFLKWIFGFFFDISTLLSILCFFYMIWYIYKSLRTFYASSKWVTLFKMCFLFVSYTIVFTLSAMMIIIITAMMV